MLTVCNPRSRFVSRYVSGWNSSHFDGLRECPQYTRPPVWRGREVPDVLLSGHHANIDAWRHEQSLLRTEAKRPDLYAAYLNERDEGKR